MNLIVFYFSLTFKCWFDFWNYHNQQDKKEQALHTVSCPYVCLPDKKTFE